MYNQRKGKERKFAEDISWRILQNKTSQFNRVCVFKQEITLGLIASIVTGVEAMD